VEVEAKTKMSHTAAVYDSGDSATDLSPSTPDSASLFTQSQYDHPATKLRRAFEDPNGFILAPGVYDGISAHVALEAGFEAMYMTGAGTSASRLGEPDIGLAELADMRAQADMLANLDPHTPLIADMDTGYGGPANVARSVASYIRAGVAAFHLEDQVQQKRCGFLAHKQVVPRHTYISRIKAAVAARQKLGSDIVIIARTDSLQPLGYEEAVARLKEAKDAGADAGLLEGPDSEEMMAKVTKELAPWPLVLNLVEGGKTPTVSADRAKELGFRCMILSLIGVVSAINALRVTYAELKKTGLVGGSKLKPKEVFDLCGLEAWMKVDEDAGGNDFKNGV